MENTENISKKQPRFKKEGKLNGRRKKLLRSWGKTLAESEEYMKNLREEGKKTAKKNANLGVHCGYEDYHVTDTEQAAIIEQAQHLYIVRKHAGSKPLNKLREKIRAVTRQINKYDRAIKAMKRIEERNAPIEAPAEDVVEEVVAEDVD